jgi:RHS repeat-associated protein
LDNGIFMRLPGQWEDELWADATSGADVFYNVHRWYETGTGRYTRVDPFASLSIEHSPFSYADQNPLVNADDLGLLALAPGQKCRGFDRAMNRLRRLRDNPSCCGFFQTAFGQQLRELIDAPDLHAIPDPQPGTNVGGGTECQRSRTSFRFGRQFCGLGHERDLSHVLLHELSHLADCRGNDLPWGRFPKRGFVEEGGAAEWTCFGRVLDEKPVFSFPFGLPVFGPPLHPR